MDVDHRPLMGRPEYTGNFRDAFELFDQQNGELVYALRINGQTFRPKVFDEQGRYRLRIGEPDEDRWQEFEDVTPVDTETIVCSFD